MGMKSTNQEKPMSVSLPPELSKTADRARSLAKIELMCNEQVMFYATVCLSLDHVWSDMNTTAWTDGTTCGYHPGFFMGCTEPQRIGLILHETLHVAYLHMLRGHGMDQQRFNKAADYVINLIIIDAGFELPPGALIDECYRGMSVEEVYRMLPVEPADPNFMLDICPPGDAEGKAETQRKIDDILIQAAIQTKLVKLSDGSQGLVPGDMQRYVNKLINPVIPWHKYLARYMSNFRKSDWSYRRPNRRYMPDYYLPTQTTEAICDVVNFGDLSGSVDQPLIDAYMSESWAIQKNLRPQSMKFIGFDTKCHEPVEMANINDFRKLPLMGGGGTRIAPCMAWCAEHKPTFAIVFSDGYFELGWRTKPGINPGIPIIWVIVDHPQFKADFGKVIHYTI